MTVEFSLRHVEWDIQVEVSKIHYYHCDDFLGNLFLASGWIGGFYVYTRGLVHKICA